MWKLFEYFIFAKFKALADVGLCAWHYAIMANNVRRGHGRGERSANNETPLGTQQNRLTNNKKKYPVSPVPSKCGCVVVSGKFIHHYATQ